MDWVVTLTIVIGGNLNAITAPSALISKSDQLQTSAFRVSISNSGINMGVMT